MSNEDALKIIKDIEDKSININSKWFYHASNFDEGIYGNILINGIKSKFLRGEFGKSYSFNGIFYISVMKALKEPIQDSAWEGFYPFYPMFVIEGISALLCKHLRFGNSLYDFFEDSFLPFRGSGYIDEYQVFNLIKPEKIVGMQFAIFEATKCTKAYRLYLGKLFRLVKLLDELSKDVFVFDYSTGKEINKDKCLTLSRSIDLD